MRDATLRHLSCDLNQCEVAAGFESLREQLDRLVEKGRRYLKTRVVAAAAKGRIAKAIPLFVVGPGLALLLQLAELVAGYPPRRLGLMTIAGASALPPLVYFVVGLARARVGSPIGRQGALALYDLHLDLKNRLVTADEFLRFDRRSGFEDAAIADATPFAREALAVDLDKIVPSAQRHHPRYWLYVLTVTGMILLSLWMSRFKDPNGPVEENGPGMAGVDRAPAILEGRITRRTVPPERAAGRNRQSAGEAEPETLRDSRPEGAEFVGAEGDARGNSRQGAQPAGRSASTAKSSRGNPGRRGSEGKGGANGAPDRTRQIAGGKASGATRQYAIASALEQAGSELPDSLATQLAGAQQRAPESGNRGNRSGEAGKARDNLQASETGQTESPTPDQAARRSPTSSRSPVSTPQQSRPGSENQGRGAEGAQRSEDALKKSRGAASMILGLPVPDQIHGQPNAGGVKTSRRESVPRQENAPPATAESRAARSAPVERLAHPELRLWERELVRSYFLNERPGRSEQESAEKDN